MRMTELKSESRVSRRAARHQGLYRADLGAPGQGLEAVFKALSTRVPPTNFWADKQRQVSGARMVVDRTHGEGFWEFLNVGRDLYVTATDSVCDQPRSETVPGEGHYEFYVKLSGKLWLEVPHGPALKLEGPSLLFLRQSQGVSIRESIEPHVRETCVSVHCRPEFVHGLLEQAAKEEIALRRDLSLREAEPVLYQQLPLAPSLACCVRSLLNCPYEGLLRLLHNEAKVLELVCLAVAAISNGQGSSTKSHRYDTRVDRARNMLHLNVAGIPDMRAVARSVGVSQSKLKRDFKASFGKTMSDYALERRMTVALDLLRAGDTPIGAIAAAVGYRHHTSFTAAFQRFFGFSPKAAAGR
jgi:AraC-like DNA-binding protein